MKHLSIFQLVVLGIFFFFIMAGAVVLAVFSKQGGSKDRAVAVTVWGTISRADMDQVIGDTEKKQRNLNITYVQKNPDSFELELIEAIATGRGPDIILSRQDYLLPLLNKLSPIPYDAYPVRTFRDTFLEEAEIYVAPYGIIALPFVVDPMVLYWNRDLFSREGIASPPRYWDEVFYLANKLTKRDAEGNISQSAVALGEFGNIDNAKEIISTLLMQSGNRITGWNAEYTSAEVQLASVQTSPESILSFYTQFADSRKPVYSWNRALPDSKSMFISGRLAMYLGFASEAREIRAKSPNLNFDISYLPQSRNSSVTATFGHLLSFSILRTSRDPGGAVSAISALTSAESVEKINSLLYLPPVRKDISAPAADPFLIIFRNSALLSKAWIDPNRKASDLIFKEMVETVVSGFATPQEAISRADQQLRAYTR